MNSTWVKYMSKILEALFVLGAVFLGLHTFSSVYADEIDNREKEDLLKTTLSNLDERSTIVLARHNEELSDEGKNDSTSDYKDWRLNIGFAYSKPDLKEADELVEAARQELALVAPNPPEFEKWEDIIKGSIWISIAKRMEIYDLPVWPEIIAAYGEGGIKTEGHGLPTIYPVAPGQFADLNFLYKTDYKYFLINFGAMAEIYSLDRLFIKAGVFGTYGRLESEVEFDSSIPLLATSRIVRGHFKGDDFGLAGLVEAGYDLKWPKNAVLALQIRYDIGQEFKGPLNIDDRTLSPFGNQTSRYSVQNISNMTGWTFNVSIGFYF